MAKSFYKERSLRSDVWWNFPFLLPFKKLKTNHTSVLFSIKFVLNKKKGEKERERLHAGYRGIFTLKKFIEL